MFELVKFKKEHFLPLRAQSASVANLDEWIKNGRADDMEKETWNYTGLLNGEVAVVGGFAHYWAGRAHAWMIPNESFARNFIPVFRGIQQALNQQPYRRVEIAIPIGCQNWHRRALLWGFKLECALAKHYLPSGEDCSLYALVREA